MGRYPRMTKPLVGIVIGSRADFNIVKRGLELLRVMGVPYLFEMASAHKTPDRVIRFAQNAPNHGLEVLICAAGGSSLAAGLLASHTTLPVIAVPIDSTPLRGQDALYSAVQSPPGVPVATVGINNGENAALLATQILALKYPKFRDVLAHQRHTASQKMESTLKEMLNEHPDLCDPGKTAPAYAAKGVAEEDTDPGDDITPEPAEPATVLERGERIRPGATLPQPVGRPSPIALGLLVPTPEPQEPATATLNDATPEDDDNTTPPAPVRPEAMQFPPPPTLSEMAPMPSLFVSASAASPPNAQLRPREVEAPRPPAPPPEIREPFVETKIFEIEYENPDIDVLSHAMMVILEGGIVAFPTDTVYGLAVDATNPEAVKRLYEVKGQDAVRKSLSVLIHTQDLLDTLVREVPPAVETVLERYWPGGLTVLFYKDPNVLSTVSESPSIAIRIPNDGIALRVMQMVERPLAVINAALGNAPAAIDATQVIDRFQGKIDCVLDAGPCRSADTSTVLSVLTEPFEILRDGIVPARDLRKILGPRLKE